MKLFKNKGALILDKLSVEVVGRKEEADRLTDILKGTEQGYLPKVISIFGPPGSGKTLVTRKVCSEYEHSSGGTFKFVFANLGEVKTVFSAANKLFIALGGESQHPRTGLDRVMDKFWSRIIDLGKSGMRFLLVGLDEIDRMFLDRRGDPSGFMYRLVRSEDRLEEIGVHLSLMTISNMIVWDYWELDERVKSSMGTEEILFSPYSDEDLKQILTNRCDEAFETGVFDGDSINALVDYTSGQSRDVRRMVDLLRISGEIAETSGSDRVEAFHIKKAIERVETDHLDSLLGRLPFIQTFMLYVMACLKEESDYKTITTSMIYHMYQGFIKSERVLSYRRIATILKELEVIGLLGGRNVSKGKEGYGREIWLKVPAKSVIDYARNKWKVGSEKSLDRKEP